MLLVGGAFGVWGLHEAAADDSAQAVAPARACVLGDLLEAGETALGSSLADATHAPDGSAKVNVSGCAVTAASSGKLTGAEVPAQVPTGERSAVRALTGGAVDAAASRGTATAVEAITPVMRPVAGLASPVVKRIAGTGLLEPVGDVVRPVAEPVVDVLPPVLAPVLDLVQPVIGPPAMPVTPRGHSAVVAPQPADGSLMPAAAPHPVPSMVAIQPQASSWAPTSGPASNNKPSKAAETTQPRWPGKPGGDTSGVTPAAPAGADGSGSAAGGTGIPADAALRAWAPSLQFLGCRGNRCGELVNRSRQPDTRPA
ncbi:hypothetical protein ACNAW0_15075 [Micromonospora sp. SL1-18]|uniref:hypothetical protein n=1 Tax=Micromonospora sp. SL1-18 TaxID=3399128 RepID=UPI003A4DF54D